MPDLRGEGLVKVLVLCTLGAVHGTFRLLYPSQWLPLWYLERKLPGVL